MKMVLKMLEDSNNLPESTDSFSDRGKFWAKIQMPDNSTGFLPTELLIDENDNLMITCPRRSGRGSFLRLFQPKPLPENTRLTLAYQDSDSDSFEIWSGLINKYLRTSSESGLEEYSLSELKQEMSLSERQFERFIVSVPLKLEFLGQKRSLNKVFGFSGCEVSENGLGLWLPITLKSKIQVGEIYRITFEPAEVDSFSFDIQCIRPHFEDSFSKGIHAGFALVNYAELKESLAFVRLKQLISARGKLPEINLTQAEHYLADFWQGEFLKFAKQ